MQITSKGQVTIPMVIREKFGFLPHTEIEFHIQDDRVYLQKMSKKSKRAQVIIEAMSGRGMGKMTTDEIMAMTRGED